MSKSPAAAQLADLPRPAAVGQTLEIFSDPWAFAVLQELFFGVHKFDDFQKRLDISRSVLTRRLRHLEDSGIITRELYCERPKRYEYRLTDAGKDMYPIFVAIRQWGERWLPNSKEPGLTLRHRDNGKSHPLELQLVCKTCGDEVHVDEIGIEG